MHRESLLMVNEAIPADFFDRMPGTSRAVFSTSFGTKIPRKLPLCKSPYVLRSDAKGVDEAQLAFELRDRYPDFVSTMMKIPNTWNEIWEYFDAVDAFTQGSAFLLRVITLMVKQNQTILTEIEREAEMWSKTNYDRLITIDIQQDVIGSLFTQDDNYYFEVGALRKTHLLLLRDRLNYYRALLEPELKMIRERQALAKKQREREEFARAEEKRYHHFRMLGK